ncbi:MAG: hypothetical protein D6B27_12410 [Gammaproteobacteria bacterium]|nr:MAG: hypothetical protein D6B27_12410 [Gammaproteobacteria bacterium]
MNIEKEEIQRGIEELRNKKTNDDVDMVNFDAICLLARISRTRGHKIAISMFVDAYREIMKNRDFSLSDIPYIE